MKRYVLTILIALLVIAMSSVCYASSIYENAEIIEHPKYGQISYCEAAENECTLEALNDWYYNYIVPTDYAWYMILFLDSNGNKGAYGTKDGIEMPVTFAKDSKGWYVGSEKYGMWYVPSGEDGLVLDMGH